MRKLNLSKSGANKSPQRTKSLLAVLVLALGLFLGMVEVGKADLSSNPSLAPCQYSQGNVANLSPWEGPKTWEMEMDNSTNCPGCKVKVIYYDRFSPKPSGTYLNC